MNYAIIGLGRIGQALAKAFARTGTEVAVATTRDPESFASEAASVGPKVIASKLEDAIEADIIFLAVRFEQHPDVAKALTSWYGKTIVDMTNAYGVRPSQLGGQPSSKVVERAFAGGRLVRDFNHLGAPVFGQDHSPACFWICASIQPGLPLQDYLIGKNPSHVLHITSVLLRKH